MVIHLLKQGVLKVWFAYNIT